jgi:hypothetical protein
MQKTYREIFEFEGTARAYLAKREAAAKADSGKTVTEIEKLFDDKAQKRPDVLRQARDLIDNHVAVARAATKAGETKFTYALRKMLKRVEDVKEDYKEEQQEINIRNCAEDKDGIIVTDAMQNFRFKKDGMLAASKERREMIDKKATIEAYIAQGDIPRDLTEEETEAFTDFVIEGKRKAR